ncbi:hypothetical protein AC578_10509 [Pseudocercospora eumusae]|uniref:Uncharacterized protein n=1 Tax=Pseudocercospora eumusae TaxID=321146 RepID=A0A139H8G8_9PEZI|nr:hypothetical protein AC578_10509 [Pseudocercospora eumusae]
MISKKRKLVEDEQAGQVPKSLRRSKRLESMEVDSKSVARGPNHTANKQCGFDSSQSLSAASFTVTEERGAVVKHAMPAPRNGNQQAQGGADTDATALNNPATDDSDTDAVSSSDCAHAIASEPMNQYPANPITGRPAGVRPTGIQSIPEELRMKIFGYLLVEDQDINLQLKSFQDKKYLIRAGSSRELGMTLMDPVHKRSMAPTPTNAAVLSVCKSFSV